MNMIWDGEKYTSDFSFVHQYGNAQIIHGALEKAFSKHGYIYQMSFYFPKIGEFATLLEDTGFQATHAILFDRLTE